MTRSRLMRECFFIVVLLGLGVLVYFSIFGNGGYHRLRQHQKQLETLAMENGRLRVENDKLIRNIKQLKSDPYAIESVAREHFNFARPGDIIVTLPRN
jgi:cell division protein FtsB